MAMARTTGWDGRPLSEKDKKFYALRDSGYKGPIDQDGNKAKDPNGILAALQRTAKKRK